MYLYDLVKSLKNDIKFKMETIFAHKISKCHGFLCKFWWYKRNVRNLILTWSYLTINGSGWDQKRREVKFWIIIFSPKKKFWIIIECLQNDKWEIDIWLQLGFVLQRRKMYMVCRHLNFSIKKKCRHLN